MMKLKLNRLALASLLSCAIISPAAGQVHQVAYEWPHGVGHQRPDTAVAASSSRIVIATNQKLELRDASDGSLMLDTSQNPPIPQSFDVQDGSGGVHPDFPLQPVSSPGAFVDPRVEWDPINDRFWLMYSESRRLHIAVSVDDSPDHFGASQWHYFTSTDSFDLGSGDIPLAVRCTQGDHPTMNIDGGYVHLGLNDFDEEEDEFRGAAVAIPITYDGSSMLSGVKTPESQISVLQVSALPFPLTDDGVFHYAVQEPHEQFTGAQFFICTSEGPLYEYDPFPPRMQYQGVQTHIRLCGRYFDAVAQEWKWVFRDLPIDTDTDYFFNPEAASPATPKLNPDWKIGTVASWFDSGVLARNANNDWRLFCGHHVVTAVEPSQGVYEPGDRTEFRYYVIDPDLSGFPSSWTPTIQVVGRAPTGGITNAETYQGAISVNSYGAAYITFTRSGTQGAAAWPSLVRARLTSNYTAIQYEVAAALAQGPQAWYSFPSGVPDGRLGVDYADMQPDPDGCNFWAIGTIVAYIDHEPEPAVPHNKRAIWITEIRACNTNAEMNGDGVVDLADYNLYLDHYAKETPQADMDGDGKVDSLDYLKYSDEYTKR